MEPNEQLLGQIVILKVGSLKYGILSLFLFK